MSATGKRVGIDLGTTNTVVAIMEGPQPRVLDSREGQPVVRSVVSLRRRKAAGGEERREILVGDVAADNWERAPLDTIVSIKRLMGRSVDDSEVQRVKEWFRYRVVEPSDGTRDSVRVVMGEREYSPVDISAMILRKIKEDAEFRLGEPVTHAVITVPAYFSPAQKLATRMAGLKANLKVIKILDEPTAAAVSYGLDMAEGGEPQTVLVYDLGGGTFDISVLMMTAGVSVSLGTAGDMWLGGDNFDQAIVEYALAEIRRDYGIDPSGDASFMVALKREAQKAKERLSAATSTELVLSGRLRDEQGLPLDVCVDLTRERYEALIAPLVARSMELVEKAMQHANISDSDVDAVILVGNATITPLVQRTLEQRFGVQRVLRKKHPKLCVAEGAAVAAKLLADTVCDICGHPNAEDAQKCENCGQPLQLLNRRICRHCDFPNEPDSEFCASCGRKLDRLTLGGIATRHYGMQLAGDRLHVFVRRGDPLPTKEPHWQPFYTQIPNQRIVCMPVWGGDDLEKASANEKQGEAFAMLPPGLAANTTVRVALMLDRDEMFDLAAHLDNGPELHPWIVKGEADHRVVQLLMGIEASLAKLAQYIGPEQRQEIEKLRDEIFQLLRAGAYDQAEQRAEELRQVVAALGQGGGGGGGERSLEERAQGLLGYTRFVLNEYGWGLPPQQALELTRLVGGLQDALDAHDEAATQRWFTELDQATDHLPEMVQSLLNIRGAINARIAPRDPERAAALLAEFDETVQAVRANPLMGMVRRAALSQSVVKAIKELESQQPAGLPCPSCGQLLPPGERFCPKCHADTWMLSAQAASSDGVISSTH